jgi:dTDP-4-dehydrorhamnose 3,5-epimerase-like enzyme
VVDRPVMDMASALPAGCRWYEFPEVIDHRGYLSFAETGRHLPFLVQRVYYIHHVPKGATRGHHAHRGLEQILIALCGSFEIVLDDGHGPVTVRLGRPNQGLYVAPMVWTSEQTFEPQTICLVLASRPYEESDYIRDYAEWQRDTRSMR